MTQNAAGLPSSTPNPSLAEEAALEDPSAAQGDLNGGRSNISRKQIPLESRYYASFEGIDWPPEIQDYNESFTRCLEKIKKRHDPVVTTIGELNMR